MTNRVLVVDDDAVLANMVVRLLGKAGIEAVTATSGEAALRLLDTGGGAFDLVILDVMMPGMDGFEVCRRIRQESEVPVMFLSAKGEEIDKVCGLTLGADDYVEKPFHPREFVARVQARLRRGRPTPGGAGSGSPELRTGGLALDPHAHAASVHDVALSLTPKEFAILELLLRRAGEPVGVAEIFEACWGEPYDVSAANTVMVHIRRLRKKIAEVDATERPITTVWGVGYKVETAPPSPPDDEPSEGRAEP